MKFYNFQSAPLLLEDDLDVVETECDLYERKRRDAESLCAVVANCSGKCLDIGTSHGRSAFKMSTNLKEGVVYTVNALPEQITSDEKMITHLLTREEIGSFYRSYHLSNIEQIYANTIGWNVPDYINNLSVAFVDGNHDTFAVYSDSKLAYDRLKDGGFILWHDFNPQLRSKYEWIDAAMTGIERFIDQYGIETEILNLQNSWIGIMQKRSAPTVFKSHFVQNLPIKEDASQPSTAISTMKSLRYLLVYPSYSSCRNEEDEALVQSIRLMGYNIETFPIPCPEGWWPFPKLDAAWSQHSSTIMKIYEKLEETSRSFDILIASGGSMLHPDFITKLSTYNVFICGDDPESSDVLSKPVAPYFDYSFTLNAACTEMYRSWGCRNYDWLFIPIHPGNLNPSITENSILNGEREIDIALFCDKAVDISDRAHRIDKLMREFPHAHVRGKGWPCGYSSHEEMKRVYMNSKLGWNLHHSSGPINARLMILPSYGVMQICDNKKHMDGIFSLDEEIVGFDTIEECIDKTRYYLNHDNERREIAAHGWKRVIRDYTDQRWWERLLSTIADDYREKKVQQVAPSFGSASSPSIYIHAKPRVVLLVDRPGWAFDAAAQAIVKHLGDEFEFRVRYVVDQPDLAAWDFDIIYVFFWGETYHQKFVTDPRKVVKEVTSHRWANELHYGCLTPVEMVNRYLYDAATITCTSRRLEQIFAPYREICFTPNGIDQAILYDLNKRQGPLRIGWAGNAADPCKGVNDILLPAAGNDFHLKIAGGDMNRREMLDFYNSIDVLCVASTAEGEPLTLLEAMACGCFPICVDIGIVPELVTHGKNGLIIARNAAAFRAAFQWCTLNVEYIRRTGGENSALIRNTRSWEHTVGHWRNSLKKALALTQKTSRPVVPSDPSSHESRTIWHRNLGDNLLEWPERAQVAAKMIKELPLGIGAKLVDLGCGHQTLRQLIPQALQYIPVDRVQRTADTRVMDLNRERPDGEFTVATMLGLIEYLDSPAEFISWVARHARFCVFSYNDCTNEEKRRQQHWESTLGFIEIERELHKNGGSILRLVDIGKNERLYAVAFASVGPYAFKGFSDSFANTKRLALFSAAVNGDNSGDALIEDAIRRILAMNEMHTFPLLQPLTTSQLEQVNACDMAIICGTNLYQTTFACSLNAEAISRIKVPIFPFGVGASAPIGTIPRMDAAGIKAVQMLHERCVLSSVRDPSSLEFIRSLGIRNVELTGCPVLFHAGKEPNFSEVSGTELYLSIRARLLHVEDGLITKELKTLDRICRDFRPVLVLQSPYDIPLAQELVSRYRLEMLIDQQYSQSPLVEGACRASRTVGFRLHFGMLSLSYGKPATLIATDTRVSEFCDMMSLRYHDIHTYNDETLVKELLSPPPDMDGFVRTWRDLRSSMASVLKANGLQNTLEPV